MEVAISATLPLACEECPTPRRRHTPQMPLSMVREGETVRIGRVRGSEELTHHLSTLGFVEGAEVSVSARSNGDTIVCVKGATLGLDREVAARISTY